MTLKLSFQKLGAVMFAFLSLLPISSFASEDSCKYTILEADGRTFLLDKETGECFRYFFNKTGEQGWERTIFDFGEINGRHYYKISASGELSSYPIQGKSTPN